MAKSFWCLELSQREDKIRNTYSIAQNLYASYHWQTLVLQLTQRNPIAFSLTKELKLKRKDFSLEKQFTRNKERMEVQKNNIFPSDPGICSNFFFFFKLLFPLLLNMILCTTYNTKKRIYSRRKAINKLFYAGQATCGDDHMVMETKLNCSNKTLLVYWTALLYKAVKLSWYLVL